MKFLWTGLLKLIVTVVILTFTIATPFALATDGPEDLQSFVMQAAHSLGLPLFPAAPTTAEENSIKTEDERNLVPLPVQPKLPPKPESSEVSRSK